MWAISPDQPQGLSKLGDKAGLGFPLLVDADSEVIKAYGILNPKQGEVPHPTVVIVDRQGVVRFFHLDEDYTRRPPAADLLAALEGLGEPAEDPLPHQETDRE